MLTTDSGIENRAYDPARMRGRRPPGTLGAILASMPDLFAPEFVIEGGGEHANLPGAFVARLESCHSPSVPPGQTRNRQRCRPPKNMFSGRTPMRHGDSRFRTRSL